MLIKFCSVKTRKKNILTQIPVSYLKVNSVHAFV